MTMAASYHHRLTNDTPVSNYIIDGSNSLSTSQRAQRAYHCDSSLDKVSNYKTFSKCDSAKIDQSFYSVDMGYIPSHEPSPPPTSGFIFTTYNYVAQKIQLYSQIYSNANPVPSIPKLRDIKDKIGYWYNRKFGTQNNL